MQTKAERKKAKVLSRIRRDKEANKRRLKRKERKHRPRPGYWIFQGVADIHRAIVCHLRSATNELISGFVECRVTSQYQPTFSDLAYQNKYAFLDYRHVMINGDVVTILAQVFVRPDGWIRGNWPSSFTTPVWRSEKTFLLADPWLFDRLDMLTDEMVTAYSTLIEEPLRGT